MIDMSREMRTYMLPQPTGETHSVQHRTPRAVFAELLQKDGADQSAMQQIEQAHEDDKSVFRNVGILLDGRRHVSSGSATAFV
jgi:hypothetical protein